jgi:hypothetical protein
MTKLAHAIVTASAITVTALALGVFMLLSGATAVHFVTKATMIVITSGATP